MSDPIQTALARVPYGVSVVTVGVGGAESGLTVSWLSQCSSRPPMLCFSIHPHHYSRELLQDHPHFVVNLLRSGQQELAARFARTALQKESKLDGLATRPAPSECLLLEDALAWFDCRVAGLHEAGDHLLVVGEIEAAGVLGDGSAMTTAEGLRYRPK
ncbi:MAG TPA: flavin reductase family protein [Myxococcota bacterium]|nr:flavin reductase family protein [Myxococcota bacterium]HRY92852.1 flavin reductase family protein [Myxococcota bacterium]HSA21230.1 flavin reductase family protein [Myxococcota bacterium]